ncbi:hypothetical protein JCGZ_09987 [Jatropha curcas]|uniref:Uncharacterized protein n=1 Tax=Jatropha curcas TaxID=180498 RepID=A0A067KIG3_JATCU|nr:hypothetical protein JCGZ_09987 [Jatropha curcas]
MLAHQPAKLALVLDDDLHAWVEDHPRPILDFVTADNILSSPLPLSFSFSGQIRMIDDKEEAVNAIRAKGLLLSANSSLMWTPGENSSDLMAFFVETNFLATMHGGHLRQLVGLVRGLKR